MSTLDRIAVDKMSARKVDENGYLHVSETNISKAVVNPYYGREIPGSEQLGLKPDQVYYLLRDPAELAKGASTFNNLPILDKHIPISSFDMDKPEVKEHYVGSTGTDATFDGKYLKNSMVLHAASAISDVQAGSKSELSCAYRYDPVMTPGTFEGKHYDGVMTNIRGNHVSLVTEGRAGHDVKVMDSKMAACSVLNPRKIAMALGVDLDAPKIRAAMGYDGGAGSGRHAEAEAASKKATRLSGLAMMSGKGVEHARAAAANHDAAVKHEALGNHARAEEHSRQARVFTARSLRAGMRGDCSMTKDVSGSITKLPATYSMPRQEAKTEHVRLVKELETPASKKVLFHEGKEQDKELKTRIEAKDTAKREDVSPRAGKSEYGDVKFADERNKKYPLDTPKHAASAASYFGMPKNRAKYSEEDATKIDKRIRAAKKKFKIGEFAESK